MSKSEIRVYNGDIETRECSVCGKEWTFKIATFDGKYRIRRRGGYNRSTCDKHFTPKKGGRGDGKLR